LVKVENQTIATGIR